MSNFRACLLPLALCLSLAAQAAAPSKWKIKSAEELKPSDDDVARNVGLTGYFNGIEISEYRFSENGFDWHLIRFVSASRPDGPLWMVPHDDENAAFDAMIVAIREHGGVGIVVNSGPGSLRRQAGRGVCGVRGAAVTSCDPNRNFDAATPLFTGAHMAEHKMGQPIIALHTNTPGFTGDGAGGSGEITILDRNAFRNGTTKPREDGHFAVSPAASMANYDTLGLVAYLAKNGRPSAQAMACRKAMNRSGVHFWHERVERSDGSMSNYLALNHSEISYFNAESRMEIDLAVAAARHKMMVDAFLANCVRSGNKPVR